MRRDGEEREEKNGTRGRRNKRKRAGEEKWNRIE
jgi:hypothetical protein